MEVEHSINLKVLKYNLPLWVLLKFTNVAQVMDWTEIVPSIGDDLMAHIFSYTSSFVLGICGCTFLNQSKNTLQKLSSTCVTLFLV